MNINSLSNKIRVIKISIIGSAILFPTLLIINLISEDSECSDDALSYFSESSDILNNGNTIADIFYTHFVSYNRSESIEVTGISGTETVENPYLSKNANVVLKEIPKPLRNCCFRKITVRGKDTRNSGTYTINLGFVRYKGDTYHDKNKHFIIEIFGYDNNRRVLLSRKIEIRKTRKSTRFIEDAIESGDCIRDYYRDLGGTYAQVVDQIANRN